MQNKLKWIISAVAIVLAGISFTSCDETVKLAGLDVTVTIASDFEGVSTEGIYVLATNTIDNTVDSVLTDATGVASFVDMAPGTYNVTASLTLSAEEAAAASGYYEEITLNGVENSVALMADATSTSAIELNGSAASSIVIKEFYYNGANYAAAGVLFKDQFVELYNNSSEVVYADGIYLASIVPQACGADDNDVAHNLDLSTYIYADRGAQIPGNGTDYPINPGESIVIAFNAVDYTMGGTYADYTVDNSTADLELYMVDWLASQGRTGNAWFDVDNADVPNMNIIYHNIENYGFFTFYSVGASIAILKSDNISVAEEDLFLDPASSETTPLLYAKLPVADVIDGMDLLYDSESADFKRLPASIDAGFNYCAVSYSSQSVRRKVAKETADGRKILMDTNNSTNDVEILNLPTPRSFN